jgi:predicted phage tail protein
MTRSLIIELATVESSLPTGRVFGMYVYALHVKGFTDAVALKTIRTGELSAQFDGVNDGTYTVTVDALDADGVKLQASVSGDVVVAGTEAVPMTYQAPTGLGFLVV